MNQTPVFATANHTSQHGRTARGWWPVIPLLVTAMMPLRAEAAPANPNADPIQSTARPFGLDIVGPVQTGGSDAASVTFQKNAITPLTAFLQSRLSEQAKVNDAAMLLDPSKLKLQTDSDVRVYFIGEGAGYQNSLGFNTAGGGVKSGNPLLIFPDASSSISALDPAKLANRSPSAPLLPGDFVDLGKFASGTKLDFFLIADGANGGRNVYSTDTSVNPDGINHVVSFVYAQKGSPYLIIGFEDLYGGGDGDFNDLLFAVDIGAANIAALTGTPEPAMVLTLGSFLGAAVWIKRRREGKSIPASEVSGT